MSTISLSENHSIQTPLFLKAGYLCVLVATSIKTWQSRCSLGSHIPLQSVCWRPFQVTYPILYLAIASWFILWRKHILGPCTQEEEMNVVNLSWNISSQNKIWWDWSSLRWMMEFIQNQAVQLQLLQNKMLQSFWERDAFFFISMVSILLIESNVVHLLVYLFLT